LDERYVDVKDVKERKQETHADDANEKIRKRPDRDTVLASDYGGGRAACFCSRF
jgi:hypothetical protein